MKKLLCLFGLLPLISLAQPANDNCSGAQSLGTLPAPGNCGSGLVNGAVVAVSTTNVNSTPENPYGYLTNCTGSSTSMAAPANDVWYSFVAPAKGYGLTVSITGATFANPNIAVYNGTCANLGGLACTVGAGGTANLSVQSGIVPGTTYYIQVSGNTGQSGTFNLNVNAFQDCSECLNASHLTVSPLPTNGMYAPGTVVSFCYHIDQWTQVSNNWLHGVQFTFGSGWNAASLTTTPPGSPYLSTSGNSSIGGTSCASNCGNWAYYAAGITDGQGNAWPAGFYFNGTYSYNLPGNGNCVGCASAADGNPGNNFGDGYSNTGLVVNPPAGSWNFCWSLTVSNSCNPGGDLSVSVTTSGDGESGNWTSAGCSGDPPTMFTAIGACCAPSTANTTTLSCNGASTGVLTATANIGASGAQNPYIFQWSNSGGTIATNTVAAGTTNSISGLPAGTYTVLITDKNLCQSTATVSIVQPTAVSATLTPAVQTCSTGGSITTSASGGTGPYSYSWNGPSGYTSSSQNPSGLNAGTYTVTVTDSKSCTFTTTTTVGSNMTPPSPTASAGAQLTCSVLTSTVHATPGAGVTYSWSGPGITSGGTSATPTVNTAGVYTVTVTDNTNGCTAQATATITSNTTPPSPTASAGPQLTCSNLTTTVNATPAAGVTYSWAGPSVTGGGTSATATVSATGVYTVTVTSTTNGCSSAATATVTNNGAVPNASASAGSPLTCATNTTTLNGSSTTGGATYSWNGPGIVSGGSTATPTVNATGVYTLTVTDPGNGCTAISTATVTLNNTPPNASALAGAALTCVTNTTTVNGSSTTGGATFNWSGPGIVSGGSTATPTVNATGVYILTVTDPSNGCTSSSNATVTLNNTPPNASATPGAALTCVTNTTTVDAASTTPGATFSWSGPSIISGATAATATVNAGGDYTVTVTDPANGCTSTATASVTTNGAFPNASATAGPSLDCSALTTTVNASSTTGGATFSWAGPGVVSGGGSATATVNTAGVYTVTVTDPANGCQSVATATVTNSTNVPNASASATSQITCSTNTATVAGNSTTAGATFTWAGPGVVSGGSSATATVNATGVYTVTVTDPATGCTNAATATVTLNNAAPNASASAGSPLTCATNSTTVTGSSTTGGATYTWAGAGVVSGGSTATPTVNATGVYTVTVTDPSNGCTSTATATVTLNNTPPNATASAASPLTCVTNTTTVTGSSTTGGATYNWAGGGIVSGGSTATPTVNATGVYTVTVTDPSNGCTNTATATVTLNNTQPNASGTGAQLTCSTTTVTITGSSNTGGATFNWSGPGIVSGGSTATPVVNASGTYTVTVTDPSNGCTNTSPVTVTTNTTPPNAGISSTGLMPCGNGTTTITGSSTTAGATFSWAGAGVVSGGNTATSTVNSAGVYVLTVTDPANGCTSTANATVNVAPPPSISGGTPDSANCGLLAGGIHGVSVNGTPSFTYNWTDASGATVGTSLILTGVGPGGYTLTVTDGNQCTATLTNMTVPGNPAVNAAFTPSPSQGTVPLTVSMTNNSTGATQYLWSFGDGSGASTAAPGVIYTSAGVYTVTLLASNASCFDTETAIIIVDDATSIIIPNIFSPNGDAINDDFIITCTGIKTLHCDIFNRWGQQVYTLESYNQSWDGKLNNGNQASEGTYFFMLEALGADGKTYKRQGPITLVK